MLHLRFFISSPGDVPDERVFAQQVIEQELPKDPMLHGKISCEAVRSDDRFARPAMVATESPQVTIDRRLPSPAECDVVIVMLWSRLGSTVAGEDHRKPDGSLYQSGTEWEFEQAIGAKPVGGRPGPLVLVYRRTGGVTLTPEDKDFDEKNEQLRKLREFLQRFDKQDGSYRRGLNYYESPQQFHDQLMNDLRAYVLERLDQLQASEEPASDDPPYRDIARALAEGQLLPFIGPGVLAGAHVPAAPHYLPSSDELSRLLAEAAHLGMQGDHDHLAEVATYYEAKETRAKLRGRLRELFGPEATAQAAIPPLYTLLARIKKPLLIITTNYDTLLERAFATESQPYDLVVYPSTDVKHMANAVLWWPHNAQHEPPKTPAPNALDVDPRKTTVIFKMHGSIQREPDLDGTVITESDYVHLLSRVGGESAIPSVLSAHLRDRSVLFVGFSLRDWSSRTIVRRLRWRKVDEEDEIPSWAVADHFEPMELMLWRRRSVYPIQVDLDKFARGLGEQWAP